MKLHLYCICTYLPFDSTVCCSIGAVGVLFTYRDQHGGSMLGTICKRVACNVSHHALFKVNLIKIAAFLPASPVGAPPLCTTG